MIDVMRELSAGPEGLLALLPPDVQAAARLGAPGRLVTRCMAVFDPLGFPPLTPVLLVTAEVGDQHVDIGSVRGHAARTVVHAAAQALRWCWLDGRDLWTYDGDVLSRWANIPEDLPAGR